MGDVHSMNDQAQVERQYRSDRNLQTRIALHARFSTNSTGWYAWYWQQVAFPAEATILELGCGPGSLWQHLLDHDPQRISPNWRITFSDLSVGMVETCRANLADRWPAAAAPPCFEVIDAQAIPLSDASVGYVLANHMLYHVPDIPATIGEIRRVLCPGGVLFASTIGRNHMRQLGDLVARFDPSLRLHHMQDQIGFVLENAQELLGAQFAQTAVLRHPDGLAITEARPIVDYALSMQETERWPDARAHNLARFIQTELDALGVINIAKDTGLAVAM